MQEDLTGRRFGRLTVTSYFKESQLFGTNQIVDIWNCQCDCGKEIQVIGVLLLRGKKKSCGCIKKLKRYGSTCKKTVNPRLYAIWTAMQQRCLNPTNQNYKYYGAKGVKVCEEWISDFANFNDWAIENGYKKDLTIDRIDVNGNYEPSNCRWISRSEQAKNKTNNVMITYQGETHCLAEWSRIKNISKVVLRYRLKRLKEQNKIDFDYLFREVKKA